MLGVGKKLSKHHPSQRDKIEGVTIDQLVPEKHLFVKMEAAADFSFIYDRVEELY
ncbi:hypothetical protein SD77_3714 [Bacillus badius]|uniref:Mobile element protein n=1 Tax=Bacillus badius TaxID=1455 RepID=A0ABR5AW06_BACBA|nr:hypothetical protein SD78_1510 [Bacillus badius]KIL78913.1 hypothetical protein SD77_3714 [Bacillus badius]